MCGLAQQAGEPLRAPNQKGQRAYMEPAGLSFISFSPEAGNE